MSTIPVVLAANDKYAPYLAVTIHSLLRHSTATNKYALIILYTDLSEYTRRKLRREITKENISADFCDITPLLTTYQLRTKGRLSSEAAYRLMCGELFSEQEKVLYLDCDVIVLNDIATLYALDMEGAYIGAVNSYVTDYVVKYVANVCHIPTADYFNTGVLLINAQAFREEKIAERGLAMLSRPHNYTLMDQDVLNILCHGHVHYLPRSWNVEWLPIVDKSCNENQRHKCIQDILNADIVHYDSYIKPWHHPELPCADIFWREARETNFYEEIIASMTHNIVEENSKKMIQAQRFIFPWNKIHMGARIIIYGAGEMGHSYLWQLSMYNYCQVVAISDKNSDKRLSYDVKFIPPQEIKNTEYDYVIIAIYNEKTVNEISEELLSMGVPINKLVHICYRFEDI